MRSLILKSINIGLLLSTILLTACSFSGDSTADQTKDYLDDRSRILSVYAPVLGTYEGEISAQVRSAADASKFEIKKIKLQLAIYTQDVQNGNDANGQSKPLPTLIVRYRQLDVVRPDELMNAARYVPESGELFGTNSPSTNNGSNSNGGSSAGGNSSYSICNSGGTVVTTLSNTHISGDTITGTIQRGNGELGSFTVTRTSTKVATAAADPVTDCNDRLADQYKTITGVYVGKLTQTQQAGGKIVDVQLNLHYVPVASSNGSIAATLVGSFNYQGVVVPSMAAVFRGETTPAQLVMSYITSGNSGGGFSLNGTLDGDTYSAEAYSGNLGLLGTLVVKKTSR